MASYSTFEPHKVVKRILLPKLMLKSLPHLLAKKDMAQARKGYEILGQPC
jgi:hypothetical protein